MVLEAFTGPSATPLAPEKTVAAGAAGLDHRAGQHRDVSLQWNPEAAAGTADRTLSADAAHDV